MIAQKLTKRGRRTSLFTMTGNSTDTVRLCWPDCHKKFAKDLGVTDTRSSKGAAIVHVPWLDRDFTVSWSLSRATSEPCDLCWDQWQGALPTP